jgi:broad specificity phosphatase PhoE
MTKIIFVRHGETAHNIQRVITSGSPGNPLTDKGKAQLREQIPVVRAHAPTAIYASPLLRARQSAEILSAGLGLPIHYRDDLRECDVGRLEGRSDEKSFDHFNAALKSWYVDFDLDCEIGPGGENGHAAVARVRRVVDEVIATHPDGCAAVVGHSTVLQLALTYLAINLAQMSGHGRWVPNGGIVIFEAGPDGMQAVECCGKPVAKLQVRTEMAR